MIKKCEICGKNKIFRKTKILDEDLSTWVYDCDCPDKEITEMNPHEPMKAKNIFKDNEKK